MVDKKELRDKILILANRGMTTSEIARELHIAEVEVVRVLEERGFRANKW